MKIKIYAKDDNAAADFASKMNLHILDWEWTGAERWVGIEWADVGSVMDQNRELRHRLMEGPE